MKICESFFSSKSFVQILKFLFNLWAKRVEQMRKHPFKHACLWALNLAFFSFEHVNTWWVKHSNEMKKVYYAHKSFICANKISKHRMHLQLQHLASLPHSNFYCGSKQFFYLLGNTHATRIFSNQLFIWMVVARLPINGIIIWVHNSCTRTIKKRTNSTNSCSLCRILSPHAKLEFHFYCNCN